MKVHSQYKKALKPFFRGVTSVLTLHPGHRCPYCEGLKVEEKKGRIAVSTGNHTVFMFSNTTSALQSDWFSVGKDMYSALDSEVEREEDSPSTPDKHGRNTFYQPA